VRVPEGHDGMRQRCVHEVLPGRLDVFKWQLLQSHTRGAGLRPWLRNAVQQRVVPAVQLLHPVPAGPSVLDHRRSSGERYLLRAVLSAVSD
jgi:hypothetical protein